MPKIQNVEDNQTVKLGYYNKNLYLIPYNQPVTYNFVTEMCENENEKACEGR